MQIHIEPDIGVPLPNDDSDIEDFISRAEAACETAKHLGLDMDPTQDDLAVAETIAYSIAEDPVAANKKLTNAKASKLRPATYYAVDGILKEFAIKVVDNAAQIRQVVTNKLILETENPDPRVRIRALELLGKISDVGLFTDRTEITINHRSTEELVISLKEKINRLRIPQEITTIDLDKELGLPQETTDASTD